MIDRMEEHGFLEGKKGYYTPEKSRASRMWATDKLVQEALIPFELAKQTILPHGEFDYVRINDKEDERETYTTPSNKKAKKMVNKLKAYNALLQATEIRALGKNGEEISGYEPAYRVFNNEEMNIGGRFYGPWWTCEGKDVRATITLDREEACEADFKSLHPYMLYDLYGTAPYDDLHGDNDPYWVMNQSTGEPYPRELMKGLALMAINASSPEKTWKAMNRKYTEKTNKATEEREIYENYIQTMDKFKPVYEDFCKKHQDVKEYISSGIGSTLQ